MTSSTVLDNCTVSPCLHPRMMQNLIKSSRWVILNKMATDAWASVTEHRLLLQFWTAIPPLIAPAARFVIMTQRQHFFFFFNSNFFRRHLFLRSDLSRAEKCLLSVNLQSISQAIQRVKVDLAAHFDSKIEAWWWWWWWPESYLGIFVYNE